MGHHETRGGPTGDPDIDSLLRVSSERHPGAVVVIAVGEIDLATLKKLTTVIHAELDGDPGTVVIDLNGVTFMGSVGLGALLEAEHAASGSGRSLRIVAGNSRSVLRTVVAAGLRDHFVLFGTVGDALAVGSPDH